MLLPAALYVLSVKFVGLYVASAIYIAIFMIWLGKYSWWKGIVVGFIINVIFFLMFEVWFKVPLFKGVLNPLGFLDTDNAPTQRPEGHLVELNALFHGFAVVLTPFNLMLMMIGIVLGVIIGVLPGLGGANGVAILLPLTFTMPPTSAIIMLSCIYWGALFGGAITSILFNIPGEPWSVATTFDGYPMAQQGERAKR